MNNFRQTNLDFPSCYGCKYFGCFYDAEYHPEESAELGRCYFNGSADQSEVVGIGNICDDYENSK